MTDKESVAPDSESADTQTDQSTGAQHDDLDTLLSQIDTEFDQETKGEPEKPDLESRVNELVVNQANTDIERAVSVIKENLGEMPVTLSDRAIRGMLNDMAMSDQRLLNAFQNRQSDPARWGKILKAAARDIRNDFQVVDQGLTEDRAALEAAVRGTQTQTADESDKMNRFFQSCSDREFNEYKRTGKIPDSFK